VDPPELGLPPDCPRALGRDVVPMCDGRYGGLTLFSGSELVAEEGQGSGPPSSGVRSMR
jgi:hypothetical protein